MKQSWLNVRALRDTTRQDTTGLCLRKDKSEPQPSVAAHLLIASEAQRFPAVSGASPIERAEGMGVVVENARIGAPVAAGAEAVFHLIGAEPTEALR